MSATITIRGKEYDAPENLLDLTTGDLIKQKMGRGLAMAVMAVKLKLYAHGRADLGYGIEATIRGQLGDQS